MNVASTAGRVARGNSGAYSAAKFAVAGWTDALHLEEKPHGVHVGLVLPGFVVTEGFPQKELVDSPRTRWIVSTPDKVADAIWDAGPGGKAERYVPRAYGLAAAARDRRAAPHAPDARRRRESPDAVHRVRSVVELIVGAVARRLVLAPALHLRAVADPPVGRVVERDLDDELGPQRDPFEIPSLRPARGLAAAALAGLERARASPAARASPWR